MRRRRLNTSVNTVPSLGSDLKSGCEVASGGLWCASHGEVEAGGSPARWTSGSGVGWGGQVWFRSHEVSGGDASVCACMCARPRDASMQQGADFLVLLVFLKVTVTYEQTQRACCAQNVRSHIDPIGKHLCFPNRPYNGGACPWKAGLSSASRSFFSMMRFLQTFPVLWQPGSRVLPRRVGSVGAVTRVARGIRLP